MRFTRPVSRYESRKRLRPLRLSQTEFHCLWSIFGKRSVKTRVGFQSRKPAWELIKTVNHHHPTTTPYFSHPPTSLFRRELMKQGWNTGWCWWLWYCGEDSGFTNTETISVLLFNIVLCLLLKQPCQLNVQRYGSVSLCNSECKLKRNEIWICKPMQVNISLQHKTKKDVTSTRIYLILKLQNPATLIQETCNVISNIHDWGTYKRISDKRG